MPSLVVDGRGSVALKRALSERAVSRLLSVASSLKSFINLYFAYSYLLKSLQVMGR